MTLSIGIIGAGRMGELHTEILQKIPNIKVVAVADTLPEKAKNLEQKYGIESYDDYRTLINSKDS